MFKLLRETLGSSSFHYLRRRGFDYHQNRCLVNVKFKWVKDRLLDSVVVGGRELRAVCVIVSLIASDSKCCLSVYHLSRRRGQLGLPQDLKVSTFVRRYPNIFEKFYLLDSDGTRVPSFRLSSEALNLYHEEKDVIRHCEREILDRFRKLLMLTKERLLPLQTIDQLKWDMGLPYDYPKSLIPQCSDMFSLVQLPDDRLGLKLLCWNDGLAVSHLQRHAALQQREEDVRNGNLAFPIGFTRGFGLKRKCMEWLEEWQKLHYTSPYLDASHLDPRTDVSEKRIVGVFHELLHLTVQKKTERKNVSNLRMPLSLPQKFTKVFERHPGIFYISRKGDTQTVVLREAYDRDQLIEKHPLVDIRERYFSMMKKGFLDKSRGLHESKFDEDADEDSLRSEFIVNGFKSEEESVLSEYESD